MIGNSRAAQNQIFNIGSPNNEISIAELAVLMRNIFADLTGDENVKQNPIEPVSSLKFYGPGYEDFTRAAETKSFDSRLMPAA